MKKIYGLIYLITCLVDKKIYVGQTVKTLQERWEKHISYTKWGGDGHLQKAFRKHGFENFKMEQIDIARNQIQLNKLEDFHIEKYKSRNPDVGYNMSWRPARGPEGRRLCSEAQIGKLNHTYRHDLNVTDLADMYESGISVSQISKIVKAAPGTILTRLRENGIEIDSKPSKIKNLPEEEICLEYTQGVAINVLAEKHKVSSYKISSILEENNVPKHKVIIQGDKTLLYKIQGEIEKGHSQRETAKILGITHSTVKYHLRKSKKPIKPVFLPSYSGKHSTCFRHDIDAKEVAKEYLEGRSTLELAKKYKTGKTTIIKRLKSLGVKLRTPKEAQLKSFHQPYPYWKGDAGPMLR